jgi:hypothetical protein
MDASALAQGQSIAMAALGLFTSNVADLSRNSSALKMHFSPQLTRVVAM